jgi:tetratricopeptide (TPR) repeat protein
MFQLDPNKKMDPVYVARCVAVAVFIGLTIVAFYGNWIGGLLWSGACLFAGALVGFLFGIPKTTQDPKAASVEIQRVNTNLEDISDWMTKIFVGLGLSQISKIPPRLQLAAGYIAYTWGDTASHRAFAYALMLYFSVVGFLGCYLLTRIFLSPLFRTIDSGESGALGRITQGGSPAPPLPPLGMLSLSDTAPDPADATGAVLNAYTDLEKKAPAASLQLHIKRLMDLRQQFPVFRMLYIVLGRLYRATGDLDRAIAVLTEFVGNKEKAGTAGDPDTAVAYYNRACYTAQKAKDATEAARQPLVDTALADLKEAFRRSPEYRDYAQADADLEPIRGSISKND